MNYHGEKKPASRFEILHKEKAAFLPLFLDPMIPKFPSVRISTEIVK